MFGAKNYNINMGGKIKLVVSAVCICNSVQFFVKLLVALTCRKCLLL